MPKKTLKRLLPSPDFIRKHPSLKFLGVLMNDPNLFHINRQSASLAFMIGLFVACLPIPFQMLVAGFLALVLRANLPISVLLVFITNPLTMPFFFYLSYKLGAWVLQIPPMGIAIEPTLDWLKSEALHIWKPLLLGSAMMGIVSGFLGYYFIYYLWRWQVVRNWEKRKNQRLGKV